MKSIRNLAVSICLFVIGNHAVAATININVSGTMSGNYPSLPSIVAGDIWRAELTIDSDTPNRRFSRELSPKVKIYAAFFPQDLVLVFLD